MKFLKNTFYFLTIISLTISFSCSKRLDLEPAIGLSSVDVYKDADNYVNVLAKLYAGMSLSGLHGPSGNPDIAGIDEGFSQYIRVLWNLQDLPTDNAICRWNDVGIPEMCKMEWSADNSFVKAMYSRIYYQIPIANVFIKETSDESMTEKGFSNEDQEELRMYRAEARFLRALSYYHAMDLFGNVPFVDETSPIGVFLPEQIQRADLFSWIESELKAIENILLTASAAPYGRASQSACHALLAKMFLNAEVYTGTEKNQDCITYSQKIIDNGSFSLDDQYAHVFMADNHTSPEIIFPVVFDGQYTQTWGGTTFLICASIGSLMDASDYGMNNGWNGLRTTPTFVNTFSDSSLDSRWMFQADSNQTLEIDILTNCPDTSGYLIGKFSNLDQNGNPGSHAQLQHADADFPMFRLADVYLMIAEASLRNGDQATALTYVNMVRERAYGNTNFNLSSVSLDDILEERGKELFWECTRRTDLIRFNKFTGSDLLWSFKGGEINGADVPQYRDLFPLPTYDIVNNINLVQNSGY
ncbi:MAG: RagB/SusD family nutrient uptake outer membrane protein [Flavobacteriales bacterium]|nr:RagB/SusD family nutrient uptake outer membrane protein [Flavobacteriales bacterium]MBL6869845.1 RagB/SusD family nutrient uptake outer membrane protein [Flavobacteriales bacterium]